MKTLATEVSNEVHQQVKDLAWFQRKSMNGLLRDAVNLYLATHKSQVELAQGIVQKSQEDQR